MLFYTDISNIDIDKLNYKSVSSYVGYLLLKYAFKKVDINLDEHEFSYNENGKPYIKEIPYHFNISHSNNIVCVLIGEEECGIDIEMINPNKEVGKIVDRFFNDYYKMIYDNLIGINKCHFFYTSWVQIEANIKKLGESILKAKNMKFPSLTVTKIKDRLKNEYFCCNTLEEKLIEIEFNELNTI